MKSQKCLFILWLAISKYKREPIRVRMSAHESYSDYLMFITLRLFYFRIIWQLGSKCGACKFYWIRFDLLLEGLGLYWRLHQSLCGFDSNSHLVLTHRGGPSGLKQVCCHGSGSESELALGSSTHYMLNSLNPDDLPVSDWLPLSRQLAPKILHARWHTPLC